MTWKKLKTPRLAKAIYSLSKENSRFLKLKLGDTIIITEECPEWFHGYLLMDANTNDHGIFPKTYVRILRSGSLKRQSSIRESVSCQNLKEEILDEMVSILHEWFPTWRELLLDGASLASTVENIMKEFIILYDEIKSAPLTTRQLLDKRNRMVRKIDFVNSKINHDLVPRVQDRPVEVEDYSFVELYEIHEDSVSRSKNLSQRGSIRHLSSMSTSTCYRLQIQYALCEYDSTDELELVWNIYNGHNKTILCEAYHQHIKCDDSSTWKSCVAFQEFYPEEILDELHLLVTVYRIGRLNPESNAGKSHRIPHGWGGISVNQSFREKRLENIKINPMKHTNVTNLSCHIRSIDVKISSDKSIEDSVVVYPPNMPVMERLILKDKPTLQKDQDNLYIVLNSGEFEKGNKSTPKNVEVKVSVRNSEGQTLEVFQRVKNKSFYLSGVNPRNNSPNWKELIQIKLPEENKCDLHLLFEFYHCTSQKMKNSEAVLFAYSCINILSDEIPIQNGTYTLAVKREENPKKLVTSQYLSSSFLLSESMEKERDSFVITTSLCSTRRLQNPTAMQFIHWRKIVSNEMMLESLRSIRSLSFTDLCKPYIREKIVTNILEILSSKPSFTIPHLDTEVFITLQHVVCCLKDKNADISFVDILIQQNPQNILKLLNCISNLLKEFLQEDLSLEIARFALHNVDYIIGQIETIEDEQLKEKCTSSLTQSCNYNIFLMNSDKPRHKEAQEIILEHLPRSITACDNLLSASLKASYIQGILESVSLNNYKMPKLKFIQAVLNCDFCQQSAIFRNMYPLIETQILEHTNEASEFLHVSMKIWGLLIKILPGLEDEHKDFIICKLLRNFLCPAICILRFIQERRKTAGLILACILTLLKEIFPARLHHHGYFFRHPEEFDKLLLLEILEMLKINVQSNLYNQDWIVLLAQSSKITLSVTNSLSEHMKINPCGVDLQTWSAFLDLCFNFILWDCLQLQNHPLYRKHKILSKYGDLRVEMMNHTLIVWNLGINFESSPELNSIRGSLLTRLLQISMLPEPTVRTRALPLLCSAFHTWFPSKEQNLSLKRTLVSNLEEYLSERKGDSNYLEILSNLASTSDHEETSTIAGQFEALTRYHLELREVQNSDDSRRKQIFCLSSLMEFYRNVFPMERFFLQYLYQLIQLLGETQCYLEAALAVELHAQLLGWTVDEKKFGLPKDACLTKEKAYINMIDFLNRAQAWEYAIPFFEELRKFYLSVYNYSQLSHTLKGEATFYERMMKEYRQPLTYFRVTFIGNNYPSYLKAKDFIYKGSPYFKLGTFQTELKADFPACEILSPQVAANKKFTDNDKVIILTEVKPIPSDEAMNKNYNIPSFVRMFHQNYRVSKFTFDRSFHTGKVEPNNEMKTLCIERTTVASREPMPCLSLWCPIVEVESHTLTPIQTASDALAKKMEELESLTNEHKTHPEKDTRPFTMKLNGVLDAGVNGGVQKYIDAFFTDEYAKSPHFKIVDLTELKRLFLNQIDVLDRALQVHGDIISEEIRDLQNRLLDCFNAMRSALTITGSPRPTDMVPVSINRRNLVSLDQTLEVDELSDYQTKARSNTDNLLKLPMTTTRKPRSTSILQDDTTQLLLNLSGNRSGNQSINEADDSSRPESGLISPAECDRLFRMSREDDMSGDWSENYHSVKMNVQPASSTDDICSVNSEKSTASCPNSPPNYAKSSKSRSWDFNSEFVNPLSYSNKFSPKHGSNNSLNKDVEFIARSISQMSPDIPRNESLPTLTMSLSHIQPPLVERYSSVQPTDQDRFSTPPNSPLKFKQSSSNIKKFFRQISSDINPKKTPLPDIPPGSVKLAKQKLAPNMSQVDGWPSTPSPKVNRKSSESPNISLSPPFK